MTQGICTTKEITHEMRI